MALLCGADCPWFCRVISVLKKDIHPYPQTALKAGIEFRDLSFHLLSLLYTGGRFIKKSFGQTRAAKMQK